MLFFCYVLFHVFTNKSGIEKSIVLIFKATDGKYYGRIEKLLEEKYAGALCIPCEGADHNKPVEGLTIIRGMTLEDGVLKDVRFMGGCNGNLKGISALVEGMKVDEVIARLEGIRCGGKPTSCPDQLCKALREI